MSGLGGRRKPKGKNSVRREAERGLRGLRLSLEMEDLVSQEAGAATCSGERKQSALSSSLLLPSPLPGCGEGRSGSPKAQPVGGTGWGSPGRA